jgi:hypothetical protein
VDTSPGGAATGRTETLNDGVSGGVGYLSAVRRKQIYKITYPNGKIYVGMDLTGTLLYFASPRAWKQICADHDIDIEGRRMGLTMTMRKEIAHRADVDG